MSLASVGHLIDPRTAQQVVLACAIRYRLPEQTRLTEPGELFHIETRGENGAGAHWPGWRRVTYHVYYVHMQLMSDPAAERWLIALTGAADQLSRHAQEGEGFV